MHKEQIQSDDAKKRCGRISFVVLPKSKSSLERHTKTKASEFKWISPKCVMIREKSDEYDDDVKTNSQSNRCVRETEP